MVKTDFIGTFTLTLVDVLGLRRRAGPKGQAAFRALAPYGGLTPPLSTADMATTYVIPDLEAVDSILRAIGVRGHAFMSALALLGGEPIPVPASIEVGKPDGEQGDPAVITLGGIWEEGQSTTVTLVLRNEDEEEDSHDFVLTAQYRLPATAGAALLAELIGASPLYHAQDSGSVVTVEPESDSYTVHASATPV